MKIIHVRWQDPCFYRQGWQTKEDFEAWIHKAPPITDSVGLLAHEDIRSIVLLQSVGENQVADAVKITRSAILSAREVGEIGVELEVSKRLLYEDR